MREDELFNLEQEMVNELFTRRSLGGFDANAGTILKLCEWIYKLNGHLLQQEREKKEKEIKKVKRK